MTKKKRKRFKGNDRFFKRRIDGKVYEGVAAGPKSKVQKAAKGWRKDGYSVRFVRWSKDSKVTSGPLKGEPTGQMFVRKTGKKKKRK